MSVDGNLNQSFMLYSEKQLFVFTQLFFLNIQLLFKQIVPKNIIIDICPIRIVDAV